MRLSILVVALSALSALGGTPIGTTRMQSLGYYNRAPAAVTASAKPAWQLDGRWQGYVGQQARLKAMAAHERAELNLLGRLTTPDQAQTGRKAYLEGLVRLQEERIAELEKMKLAVQTEYQLRDLKAVPVAP
jgi:hypothetical protein